jgi:hypothetical protein
VASLHKVQPRRRKQKKNERGKENRATRLGQFSPFGRLFTFGYFIKITKAVHILGYFFHSQCYVFLYLKNGLGDFFRNASGHPDRNEDSAFAVISSGPAFSFVVHENHLFGRNQGDQTSF